MFFLFGFIPSTVTFPTLPRDGMEITGNGMIHPGRYPVRLVDVTLKIHPFLGHIPSVSMEHLGISQAYPLVNVYITNWKITMKFMGKSTISMAIFNSKLLAYQRVGKPVTCGIALDQVNQEQLRCLTNL